MSRKCAILVLVVMVLSTVAPALACLAPSATHACCPSSMSGNMPGMMQQDNSAATMSPNNSCCTLRSPASTVPPERAASELNSATALAPQDGINPAVLAAQSSPFGSGAAKAPPPRSFLGGITILRI